MCWWDSVIECSGATAQLGAHHPLLLLEYAHDVDEDVLGDRVALRESVHPLAHALADLRDAIGDVPDDRMAVERLGRDRYQLRFGRDRAPLPVRHEAQGDRSLSDLVREIPPRVDQLVELEVDRSERRPDD